MPVTFDELKHFQSTTETDDLKDIKMYDKLCSQCIGKRRHETEQDAMIEVRVSDAYLEVYLCPFCGYYHTGKNKEVHKNTLRSKRKRKRRV